MTSTSKILFCLLALSACSDTESAPPPPRGTPRPTLALEHTLKAHSVPRELAFSPNGQFLATSGADSTVKLWRVEEGTPVRVLAHPAAVASIAYSPDGQWLASGGYDGGVRVWRVADGTLARTLSGHSGTVWSVAFSPGGERIASSGEDKTIRLWRASDGGAIRTMTGHSLNVWSVDFSADGKYLASGSFDHSVRLWDAKTGDSVRTLAGHDQAVVGVAFSPKGNLLASGGDDSAIRIWNADTGELVRRIDAGNHIYQVAFSPDGNYLMSAGRARGPVATLWHQISNSRLGNRRAEPLKLWKVSDGTLVQSIPGHADDVWSVAVSRDGRWVASASGDMTVKVWRVRIFSW